MLSEPEPLPAHAAIDYFTPDNTGSWYVAYAGPCGDPDCKLTHRRLYVIPMIGWLSYEVPILSGSDVIATNVLVRPAVMNPSGKIEDFLDTGGEFRFIAVLRGAQEMATVAKEIYRKRYGDNDLMSEKDDVETVKATVN